MPPSTARQTAAETDIFKLDGTDICTLPPHLTSAPTRPCKTGWSNELKNRGVEDVLIAIVDGLKGFPEAIIAVFPQATVQTCIAAMG